MRFFNNNNDRPFLKFRKLYTQACDVENFDIEAAVIASLNVENNEVEARYVNIKILDEKKFIFFSNYNSPKAQQFKLHNQAALVFYWPISNIQIRIKGEIEMIAAEYSDNFFMNRSLFKNALAICSKQSQPIDSYKMMKEKYKDSLHNNNLSVRPEYWGGYSLTPYYFEFWEGHESRINKRKIFNKIDGSWKKSYLQP